MSKNFDEEYKNMVEELDGLLLKFERLERAYNELKKEKDPSSEAVGALEAEYKQLSEKMVQLKECVKELKNNKTQSIRTANKKTANKKLVNKIKPDKDKK